MYKQITRLFFIASAVALFAVPFGARAGTTLGAVCNPSTEVCVSAFDKNGNVVKYECRAAGDASNPTETRCLVEVAQPCPDLNFPGSPVSPVTGIEGDKGDYCDKEADLKVSTDPNTSICTDVGSNILQCQLRANEPGDTCKGLEQCTALDPDLECTDAAVGKKCVADPGARMIGTWCDSAAHCNTLEGFLKLTCNTDENYCVGASSKVECADDDVNKNKELGETNVEQFNRCDRNSLFCNDNFLCQADLGTTTASTIAGTGTSTEDIRDLVRKLINIALGFLGVAGVIVTMYGGALWMSAAGEDEKVEKAKKTIVSGLIGLIIIGIAWTIVSYVLAVTQTTAG